MLTYTITQGGNGYRIQLNGIDWIVQENGVIPYPGKTMDESIINHMNTLQDVLNTDQKIDQALKSISDVELYAAIQYTDTDYRLILLENNLGEQGGIV